MPFKELEEGQTYSCPHKTNNPSGICDNCLGEEPKEQELCCGKHPKNWDKSCICECHNPKECRHHFCAGYKGRICDKCLKYESEQEPQQDCNHKWELVTSEREKTWQCKICKKVTQYEPKQEPQQESWEIEFDKLKVWSKYTYPELKQFIRNLLQAREQELKTEWWIKANKDCDKAITELKEKAMKYKQKNDMPSMSHFECEEDAWGDGYNHGIEEFRDFIKELK